MDDIARKRWERDPDPAKHQPSHALEKMLDDIRNGDVNPTHIVIAYITDENVVGFYQAGQRDKTGAIGILSRAAMIMEGA